MELMKLRISDMIYGPGDTLILSFEVLDGPRPTYLAGQFLTLVFNVRGREVRRSYSLCSAPNLNEPLSIAIKKIENGEISRLLHHKTAIGEVLYSMPPNGLFTYLTEKSVKRDVFLFAAGVGITPLFSIIKTALYEEEYSRIVLAYSNRSATQALFYKELNDLQEQFPERFKVIFLFSQSQDLRMARLNVSLIESIVSESLQFEKEDALFYTCGPIDYMVTCRIILLKLGFSINQIKRETFVLPEDEADDDDTTEKKIKDTNTYSVILNFKGTEHRLDIPYYKSILAVALENKIDLPYSCRAGICSSCTANCTSGHVRMDYNEVLTDQEVDSGRVLVCTGHPTENDTTIVW